MPRHQLLVTLDVRPAAFEGYIAAMREEEAGARSEAGNLGFDLWGDATRPHVIHLLEFWASENALHVDHAKQPYYRHVRGMEADALTGAFEERLLVEQGAGPHQTLGAGKSVGTQTARVTVWSEPPADLIAAYDHCAQAVRTAPGSRFWQLYANPRRAGEMVLIEAWDDEAARQRAARSSAALRALANPVTTGVIALRKL